MPTPYAELTCFTNFSFLRGASHPVELIEKAAELGLHAIAVTDLHTMAGMVRAFEAAEDTGMKLLVGTRIEPRDAPPLCLYAMNRQGYSNICRLLTLGKRRVEKGQCELFAADLADWCSDVQAVVIPGRATDASALEHYIQLFGDRLSIAISRHLEPADDARLEHMTDLASQTGIALVATNDVHMHCADRKAMHDVVTCIREGVKLTEAGSLLFPNAERRLKSGDEMATLLPEHAEAIARSAQIADACTFNMRELRYEYPQEVTEDGLSMREYLKRETWRGAARIYGETVPEKVSKQLTHELALIAEMDYDAYFLTVYDIVKFARSQGILCQGRGSAANSAVCHCLGITPVDPNRNNLLFERFISRERAEPPDIDVDFEHERREEVIQYIYKKYGRHRAGLTATVIRYRGRSSIREVGKVLGLSLDQVDRLAKNRQWWDDGDKGDERIREAGLDPKDRNVALARKLATEIQGFPRHLSQHVGGFVIARDRLDDLVPIENAAMKDRTVIEWDKDDIATLKMMKVDCLGLGMLAVIHKALDYIEQSGGRAYTMSDCLASDGDGSGESPEAKAVYTMLQEADAIGTFQVESRAQLSMLPRLKPAKFYDLVIEVAIVRPGPIQGGMVHPYLRRRNGEEEVDFAIPELEPVLGRTLGIPLFQEQAMSVAVVAAGFTPGEADQLRKAMGGWRRLGLIDKYHEKLVTGMAAKGIPNELAERIFKQIKGFGDYGFPESHAASFALITYVTAYLKRFYPAALTAGLINAQPMGFYSVSTLVRDAREHEVEFRPIDVNLSQWDCTLEKLDSDAAPPDHYGPVPLDAKPSGWGGFGPAIRLGMRQVRGLDKETGEAIAEARAADGPYRSISDLFRRLEARIEGDRFRTALARLAAADAMRSLGLSRRGALWAVQGLREKAPALFADLDQDEPEVKLPALDAQDSMITDYATTGLSLDAHPLEFLRAELDQAGVEPAANLLVANNGRAIEIAGIVLSRQRPSTAKGILFVTLEDETGVANLIIRTDVYEEHRRTIVGSPLLVVKGRVERQGKVIHVLAKSVYSIADRLEGLHPSSHDFH